MAPQPDPHDPDGQLRAALWRIPELHGRELTLTPLSGGLTNRNFLVEAAGVADIWSRASSWAGRWPRSRCTIPPC